MGDFSRKLFDQKKEYDAVLMQQGRVMLDADWNEQLDLAHYRRNTETIDVIGRTGVPKNSDGFKISVLPAGADIQLSEGRIYVEGQLCELSNEPGKVTTYLHQPWYTNPDVANFSIVPNSPPTSPVQTTTKLKDGNYLVYLEAWQRERTFLDDPHIREVALGETDTTTRLQNIWQVKLLKLSPNNIDLDCKTLYPEWDSLIKVPDGRLRAQTADIPPGTNPCILPPSSGYRRLENQLYRVEIQQESPLSFKWSRDNATVETAITKAYLNKLEVASLGKDDVLGFLPGQWVEVVNEENATGAAQTSLKKIVDIDVDAKVITLDSSVATFENVPGLKLRRWDQQGSIATAAGIVVTSGWMDLEDGIQVNFSSGKFKAGSYWYIPARTLTGDIEWPAIDMGDPASGMRLPDGTPHYFAKLGLIQVAGTVIKTVDCRKRFPALTELTASDVSVDNTNCKMPGVTTVQQAIDQLCKKKESTCTVMAIPGKGWEVVFDAIAEKQDAQICFQVGVYPLDATVTIKNKGNLKLLGCGPGTRIVAQQAEAALNFEGCPSVLIRDLYAESGLGTFDQNERVKHLNGTLTFTECGAVSLDSLWVQCPAGTVRSASCITVNNTDVKPGRATIQNCTLRVGNRQQGILLINQQKAFVENNEINVYASPAKAKPLEMLKTSKSYRTVIRKLFYANPVVEQRTATDSKTNIIINTGHGGVSFDTHPDLGEGFQAYMRGYTPQKIQTGKQLYKYLDTQVDKLMTDDASRKLFPKLDKLFVDIIGQDMDVMAQGITVGGKVGEDIRILNNTVQKAIQGIHVGFSYKNDTKEPYLGGNIKIEGNNLLIVLPTDIGNQERYGMFVGNCNNLLIENNNIHLSRLKETDGIRIYGIHVFGVFGERMMITKNFAGAADGNRDRSFNTGINVEAVKDPLYRGQWIVMWNTAPSKSATLVVAGGVTDVPQTNMPL